MKDRSPPLALWLALGAALAAMLGFALAGLADQAAWRLGLTIAAGLSLASVILAMTGRLLSRQWLDLIEDELLPAGATLALVAILALPFLGADPIADTPGANRIVERHPLWFSGEAIFVRIALAVALGIAGAWCMWRLRGLRYRVAAAGLPVLAAIFALVVVDWVMLRPPVWWTALLPMGFVINQLTAALALAFVYHLTQRERGEEAAFASLAAALLSLGLLDLWIGFVQFLIAWYGNLPDAARWYLTRSEPAPALLPLAAVLHGIGLLILVLRRTRKTMLAAAGLLLAAYLANAVWLAGGLAPAQFPTLALLLGLWLGWLAALARLFDARKLEGSAARGDGRSGGIA